MISKTIKNIQHGLITILLSAMIAESPLAEESPLPEARVARAAFTTEIVNREPADQIIELKNDRTEIIFFTDLRNLRGRTVLHRWEYKGKTMSEIAFQVNGPRWRVHSRKILDPVQTGDWIVTVLDAETGWPLQSEMFRYVKAGPTPVDGQ